MAATSYIRLALALAVAVAAAVLAPRPVHAQSAEAQALFDEGRRLMKEGDIAHACDKFEAADRVDPTAGTELSLGDCREKNGQFATAWAVFLKAEATAKRARDFKRAAEAHRRVANVKPKLVYLTIAVSGEARVGGLVIKRNGTAVEEGAWNQRIPIDPDKYTISGEVPGYKPWSTSVEVKTKDETVEVPALEKRPEAKPPAAVADGEHSSAEAGPPPSLWTGKRKLSLVVAAVGIAAAGAGVGFWLHANHLESQSDTLCDQRLCHSQDAVDLNQSARHYALAANIGYAAGGAAVVGAAVLWFLGAPRAPGMARPNDTGVIPTFGAGRVGVAFARSF